MSVQGEVLRKWLNTPRQNHAVAYYPSEAALIDSLYTYIHSGADSKDNCLIITNMAVMKHLHQVLRAKHIDSSNYTILLADSVLEDFMVDGMPDKHKFFKKINDILAKSAKAGQPVRLYGDMVAQLWEKGNRPAALALEKLWNDFARTRQFSLYCAYPAQLFQTGDDPERSNVDAQHDVHALLGA